MSAAKSDYIVLGAAGLIGSAVSAYLTSQGKSVIPVTRENYSQHVGKTACALINCNGNTYRYKANQDPAWDFEASVTSVERSLNDFKTEFYIYFSTVDVYDNRQDPRCNHEDGEIDIKKLDAYGSHKWMAENLVRKSANRALVLRLGTVIGPGMKKGPLYDLMSGNPLHMSLDSQLTLVDTATIAKAIDLFLENPPVHETVNITGSGAARLRDLQPLIPSTVAMAPGAEKIIYQYNLNNKRMNSLMPVSSSLDMAKDFLKNHIGAGTPQRS